MSTATTAIRSKQWRSSLRRTTAAGHHTTSSPLPNPWKLNVDFKVVTRESGATRTDIPIFTARKNAIAMEKSDDRNEEVRREFVPGAPGVFLLSNLLSDHECEQLVALSEQMGYCEDAPVSLSREIRQNDNCVWIADQESLNRVIFDRCKHLLPEYSVTTSGPARGPQKDDPMWRSREFYGENSSAKEQADPDNEDENYLVEPSKKLLKIGPVTGLNQRWRLYRYNTKDIFRPHTDGSWPGSALSSADFERDDQTLVQDFYHGRQHSLLTFLMYLNDDCEGGETTFYYDSSDSLYRDVLLNSSSLSLASGMTMQEDPTLKSLNEEEAELQAELQAEAAGSSTAATSTSLGTPSAAGSSGTTSTSSRTKLVRISVKPKKGAALVFWHGQHPLSPLHEGSRVETGRKYVIRTDVLYSTVGDGSAAAMSHWPQFFQKHGRTQSIAEKATRVLHAISSSQKAVGNQPRIGNLSAPDSRINQRVCLLLFLDDAEIDPAEKQRLAMLVAEYSQQFADDEEDGSSSCSYPVYCAVSSQGAVGQIRELISSGNKDDTGSSATATKSADSLLRFALLDIPNARCGICTTKEPFQSCQELQKWLTDCRNAFETDVNRTERVEVRKLQ